MLNTVRQVGVDGTDADSITAAMMDGRKETSDLLAIMKEYFPGLFACGMSANNVSGGYRMGPIFGGMLLSGRKAANLIMKKIKK